MNDYLEDLSQQCLNNKNYRRVVHTGDNTQTVIMCIPAGGEIGMETHPDNEQAIFIFSGHGLAMLDGQEQKVVNGDALVVRPGVRHNIINTSTDALRIVTVYSPPHHRNGVVHRTREEADADTTDKPLA